MLGSFMMLASGFSVSSPSAVSSSLMRWAGVSFSGKLARMRPASEMSRSFTETSAAPTKASTIGKSEKVASAGASSVFVHMISRFDILAPLFVELELADRELVNVECVKRALWSSLQSVLPAWGSPDADGADNLVGR